ncbi:BURP domain-containing protein 12-like [Dendrobium catenatum]|uniref:BURP domain-containing protein 12 n=1 Tax=Dendrobium catenatum TaxID=906689 RepID=A0A2I0WMJ0_9ASPA|nr:BURP domain-containing protein 12-like [Dendrobium catenatum]PKU76880.1 BURP domain-containing protein 12 [Dendrobium catenatum]
MDFYLILAILISLALSTTAAENSPAPAKSSSNPFTEKAALLRYWNRKIPNSSRHPQFLVSKLTPLSISDAAKFSTIAASDPFKLSSSLPSFCSAAALLCTTELTPSLASHPSDSAFSSYENSNFSNYANTASEGLSSFKNYFGNEVPLSTFNRYGHDSGGHNDSFAKYGPGNVDTGANFTSYGANSASGNDKFNVYANSTDGVALGFTNYVTNASGRIAGFVHYGDDSNVGQQIFSRYGKDGSGTASDFTTYAHKYSNIIESGFSHYGENAAGNVDNFKTYSEHANIPNNHFESYGSGTTDGTERFTTYRHQSNIGDDSFTSYEKDGIFGTAEFNNYGNESSGTDAFKGYGENSTYGNITFKSYFEDDTTFKGYANTGIDFKSYHNSSSAKIHTESRHPQVNQRVEAGKFFRESSLKKGTVMPMPDIHDRMQPRSFLPRSIAGKIPLSVTAVTEIFKIPPGTAMAKAVASTVADCERLPSRGETKRCATSAEDMIDFAVSTLGSNVEVRSSTNTKGSKGNILIGEVKGVNGGNITESVSCHQSLFPYLVYYCHSVPRVRVYEAEILAVDSKEEINHGIAICHIDTSDWSPNHGAFVALGPGPGKIEVCHWIYEGDMTWTVRDPA